MKRKILALVLACLMIVSAVPVSAIDAGSEHVVACPGQGEKHTLDNCEATKVGTVDAICGEYGYTAYKCDNCGDHFAADFVEPVEEHVWETKAEAVAPTCDENGKTAELKCTLCGSVQESEVVPALNHVTIEYVWEAEQEIMIPVENVVLDHPYLQVEITEADCKNGTKITYSCSECDWTKVIDEGPRDHDWGRPILDKAPTATESGLAHYECQREGCEATHSVKINPAHDHDIKVVFEGKEPTCTEDGMFAYGYCALCGMYFVNAEVLADAAWLNVLESVNANDFESAMIAYENLMAFYETIRSNLNNRFEDLMLVGIGHNEEQVKIDLTIPALGHDLCKGGNDCKDGGWLDGNHYCELVREPKCNVAGLYTVYCFACDEDIEFEFWYDEDARDHVFHYEIKDDPTCEEWGFQAYVCKYCGFVDEEKSEALPPLGHMDAPSMDWVMNWPQIKVEVPANGQVEYTFTSLWVEDWYSVSLPEILDNDRAVIYVKENGVLIPLDFIVDYKPVYGHMEWSEELDDYIYVAGEPFDMIVDLEPVYGEYKFWLENAGDSITFVFQSADGKAAEFALDIDAYYDDWLEAPYNFVINDEPTCTKPGSMDYTCIRPDCGKVFEDVELPALGCDLETFVIPGNCQFPELTITYCTRHKECDAEENTYFNYRYNPDFSAKQNTSLVMYLATEDAENDIRYDFAIPADSPIHRAFYNGVVIKSIVVGEKNDAEHILHKEYLDPNSLDCTTDREYMYICLGCHWDGGRQVEEAPGHEFIMDKEDPDFSKYNTLKSELSCTSDEVYTMQCINCEHTEDVVTIESDGHNYILMDEVDTSCSERGYKYFVCSNDNCPVREVYEYKDEYVETLDFTSVEDAYKLHLNMTGDHFELFYEGNCINGLDSIYHGECPDCGKNIIIRVASEHDMEMTDPGYSADCLNPGKMPTYECQFEGCDHKTGGEAISALGHIMTKTEAKDPTCENPGNKDYWYCERCELYYGTAAGKGEGYKTNAPFGLEPTWHPNKVSAGFVADCLNFGGVHTYCPDCGMDYIDQFKAALGHDVVTVPQDGPHCDREGWSEWSYCDRCDLIFDEGESIPATGHWVDVNGEKYPLEDSCLNIIPGFIERKCGDCGEIIPASHKHVDEMYVPATCLEYGYYLFICLDCDFFYVDFIDDSYLADHTEGYWVTTVNPTYTSAGYRELHCDICDIVLRGEEIAPLVGINYSLDIDNDVRPGAGYSDGSVISVTVNMSGFEMGWWGMEFDVDYDEEAMKFLADETQFYTESGAEITYTNNAIELDGKVHVISVHNSVDIEDDFVDGDQTLVTLKFLVNNPDAREALFSIGNFDVINGKGEQLRCIGEEEAIEIRPFMNPDGNDKINLVDLQYLYAICSGAIEVEYDVTVDTNRDGKMNVLDIYDMFNYMSNDRDEDLYEIIVGRG